MSAAKINIEMNLDGLYNCYTIGFIATENSRSFGTCFVASFRDDIFLITDCHVLYCRRTEDLYDTHISVRFTHQDSGPDDGAILSLNIKKDDVWFDESLDIALIKINGLAEGKLEFLTESYEVLKPLPILMFDLGSQWSKDAYILGFPHSGSLDSAFDSKPTLSRGVVSAVDINKGHLIVDIPSIYGLSGSPVFGVINNEISIIGIVQKLFPFNAEWFSKNEPGISRSDWHNSGYTKCLSATRIKNFIEDHEGAN